MKTEINIKLAEGLEDSTAHVPMNEFMVAAFLTLNDGDDDACRTVLVREFIELVSKFTITLRAVWTYCLAVVGVLCS